MWMSLSNVPKTCPNMVRYSYYAISISTTTLIPEMKSYHGIQCFFNMILFLRWHLIINNQCIILEALCMLVLWKFSMCVGEWKFFSQSWRTETLIYDVIRRESLELLRQRRISCRIFGQSGIAQGPFMTIPAHFPPALQWNKTCLGVRKKAYSLRPPE